VIEVTRAMLEEKIKQAKGEAPFIRDKICEALLALDWSEFRKLPGIVQNYAGLYDSAKRRVEQLKEVA
jgi:hypothetical protein